MKVKKLDIKGHEAIKIDRDEYLNNVDKFSPVLNAKLKYNKLTQKTVAKGFNKSEALICRILKGERFNLDIVNYMLNLPPKELRVQCVL